LEQAQETFIQKMKRKIVSIFGSHIYSNRIGTSEPVFANIRHALGLSLFTLRGRRKMDIQCKLYCMVHNLIKIHRYEAGFAWMEQPDRNHVLVNNLCWYCKGIENFGCWIKK
jgi:hypothetical protein